MDNSMRMPPPSYEPPPRGLSTGQKTLIGCGIGCATVIILIFVVIGFGAWWLFKSEDQVATNRILNTDSMAVFRLEDIIENQGAMELISYLLKEAQRNSRERSSGQLPPFLEKFKDYSDDQQDPTQFMKFLAPREITASMSLDEAGKDILVIAANFGAGTRIAKTILKMTSMGDNDLKAETISTSHGELYVFNQRNPEAGFMFQQVVMGFYKGTFLFSNETESAVSALGRLAEGNDTGELNETLSDSFIRFSQEGCLAYGVLNGHFLKNTDFDIGPFESDLRSGMEKMEISVGNLSVDEGILNVLIDWNNEDSAHMALEKIEDLKTDWINRADQEGFDLEVLNSLNDKQQDIQFRVNNLKKALTPHTRSTGS